MTIRPSFFPSEKTVEQNIRESERESLPARVKRKKEGCEIGVGGFHCHKSSHSCCCTVPVPNSKTKQNIIDETNKVSESQRDKQQEYLKREKEVTAAIGICLEPKELSFRNE